MCQLKYGSVTDSKPGFIKASFPAADYLPSTWIPVIAGSSHGDQDGATLAKGTFVACLMDAHADSGVCLGPIYSDLDAPPTTSADVWMKKFADGTILSYDKGSKTLTASVAGAGTAEITAATVKVNGDLQVSGNVSAANVSATGDVSVGAITLLHHVHLGNMGAPTGESMAG